MVVESSSRILRNLDKSNDTQVCGWIKPLRKVILNYVLKSNVEQLEREFASVYFPQASKTNSDSDTKKAVGRRKVQLLAELYGGHMHERNH